MRSAANKYVASLLGVPRKLVHDSKFRWYVTYVLAADALGCALVYILMHQTSMNTYWANFTVSKGMAPVGMMLNSLALTGRLIPNRHHATKWFNCWLPSTLTTSIYLGLWVSLTNVQGVSARLVVGLTFFPVDFVLKRYFVFGPYSQWLRFYATRLWVSYKLGTLLQDLLAWRPTIFVGPTPFLNFKYGFGGLQAFSRCGGDYSI